MTIKLSSRLPKWFSVLAVWGELIRVAKDLEVEEISKEIPNLEEDVTEETIMDDE